METVGNFFSIIPDCLKVLNDGDLMDGELYSHGGATFQELIALIKREKNANTDGLKQYVYFWNYDWCLPEPFHQRQRRLKDEGYIKAVPTYQVQNEQDARAYHAQFTQEGYEGSMIRSGGDEPYRSKYRSPSLLKLKDFQDDDFVIIGAKDSVGKAEGQCVFRCQTTAKDEFDVRMKGTRLTFSDIAAPGPDVLLARPGSGSKLLSVNWVTEQADVPISGRCGNLVVPLTS